jgi:hypothetical protein
LYFSFCDVYCAANLLETKREKSQSYKKIRAKSQLAFRGRYRKAPTFYYQYI